MVKKILWGVEITAYVTFYLLIASIWANMLGDYHRVSYDTPGSLGLPICLLVAAFAHHWRGAR
jgi:hypothetical protein